jgi:DNA-binding GntR family transcriptional regulator
MILNKRLESGKRLLIKQLSNMISVSESPVREALNQLCSEGLVTMVPHSGAFVSILNDNDMREIFQIRNELEVFATSLAVPNIDSKAIKALEVLLKRMTKAASAKDHQSYRKLNTEFHRLIYNVSGNRRLCEMIFRLRGDADRGQVVFALIGDRMARSLEEHREIYSALKRGTVEGAISAMRIHRQSATSQVLEALESNIGREGRT